ncbi:profilin-1-like [Megalops cyprinoides]|uniref:profilin-1-like n=1 Tax=Megalops cyprinoides TaxID=118141 RepID=UPI001863A7C2|nr:profilin-1-like [Megalops cyprinoides]
MSWDDYITNLMSGGEMKDAAIVGCVSASESVWAAHPTGQFKAITAAEIRQLVGKDRSSFFSNGVTLGGIKCTVLRDTLNDENSMDLRTKASEADTQTCNISVGKSNTALVILKGNHGVHGGTVNVKAFNMAEHLRKSGY